MLETPDNRSAFETGRVRYALGDRDFDGIRTMVRRLTGISIAPTKRMLIYRRLAGRLKARQLDSFGDYLALLNAGDRDELEHFINAITTNQTSFFREQHHFEYLASTIIPELVAAKGALKRRLRVWSAGCSSGEEPYSIAMTLRECMPDLDAWDARVLCTDLDSNVVARGKDGVYPRDRVERIPANYLERWFDGEKQDGSDTVRVRQALRALTVFKRLNLIGPWPMRGKFDAIFCRNVFIYFDKQTQRELVERFANALEDGGYLILGHSESMYEVSERFALVGNTVYRKVR